MMYPEEVVDKLLRIMATCDAGCHICVGNLFYLVNLHVPELTEKANKIFLEEIGYNYIEDRWEREDS